jgi:ankyrin repeat protein
MNKQLAELMRGFENQYPHKLDELYPRIVDKIVELWRDPENLEAYFQELMIPDRHERQGFPPQIASELFTFSNAYEKMVALAKSRGDCWGNEVERPQNSSGKPRTSEAFFKSLASGNAKEIILLLDSGIDLEQRDQRGWTPMMIAAFEGSEEMVLLLIEHGANVFAKDKKGYAPIHFAAYRNFTKVVAQLLKMNIDPNSQSDAGTTPLLQAAARGNIEVVEQLLKAEVSPNLANNEGWTPLHKAVANRHQTVVEALMKYKANPNATHNSGVTPLAIAKNKGFKEIVVLLQHGLPF